MVIGLKAEAKAKKLASICHEDKGLPNTYNSLMILLYFNNSLKIVFVKTMANVQTKLKFPESLKVII